MSIHVGSWLSRVLYIHAALNLRYQRGWFLMMLQTMKLWGLMVGKFICLHPLPSQHDSVLK
jgi:hypothetical protein